jgi:hypothetical protein
VQGVVQVLTKRERMAAGSCYASSVDLAGWLAGWHNQAWP